MNTNYENAIEPFDYVEKASYNKLSLILSNPECLDFLNRDGQKIPPLGKISRYVGQHISGDEFKVKYESSRFINKGFGRLNVVGGFGLATLPKDVRNFVSSDFYRDYDIVNCHPTIFDGLFKRYDIDCPELSEYISNRSGMMEKYGFEKNDFMLVMYYEDFETDNVFLKKIHGIVYDKFVKLLEMDYPIIFDQCKKSRSIGDFTGFLGRFLAHIVQSIEVKMMKIMVREFEKDGFVVGAFVHDGIMVEKTKSVVSGFLDGISSCIFEELGFDVSIIEKPMISNLVLEDSVFSCDSLESAAQKFIELNLSRFVNTVEGPYFKNVHNCWVRMCSKSNWKNDIQGMYIMSNIGVLKTNGKNVVFEKISSLIDKWCLLNKFILSNISTFECDSTFLKKLDGNIGYIIFRDVALHHDGTTIPSNSDKLFFTSKIERDLYKRPEKKYFDKLFTGEFNYNEIFNDDIELRDDFARKVSRSIFGYCKDKDFLIARGGRNSGKGMITHLIEHTFLGLFNTFDADAFSISVSNESNERDKSKFANLTCARISISNEVKRDKWSSDAIKSCTSGGDTLTFRMAFGSTTTRYIRSSPFVFCNSIPEIDQLDGFQYLLLLEFPCVFNRVSDPDCLYVEKVAVDGKEMMFSDSEELKAAYFWYIVDNFGPSSYTSMRNAALEYVENIRPSDKFDKLMDLLVVTNDKSDFVDIEYLSFLVKSFNLDIIVSSKIFSMKMKKAGHSKVRRKVPNVKNKIVGYCGLRKKTSEEIRIDSQQNEYGEILFSDL